MRSRPGRRRAVSTSVRATPPRLVRPVRRTNRSSSAHRLLLEASFRYSTRARHRTASFLPQRARTKRMIVSASRVPLDPATFPPRNAARSTTVYKPYRPCHAAATCARARFRQLGELIELHPGLDERLCRSLPSRKEREIHDTLPARRGWGGGALVRRVHDVDDPLCSRAEQPQSPTALGEFACATEPPSRTPPAQACSISLLSGTYSLAIDASLERRSGVLPEMRRQAWAVETKKLIH